MHDILSEYKVQRSYQVNGQNALDFSQLAANDPVFTPNLQNWDSAHTHTQTRARARTHTHIHTNKHARPRARKKCFVFFPHSTLLLLLPLLLVKRRRRRQETMMPDGIDDLSQKTKLPPYPHPTLFFPNDLKTCPHWGEKYATRPVSSTCPELFPPQTPNTDRQEKQLQRRMNLSPKHAGLRGWGWGRRGASNLFMQTSSGMRYQPTLSSRVLKASGEGLYAPLRREIGGGGGGGMAKFKTCIFLSEPLRTRLPCLSVHTYI